VLDARPLRLARRWLRLFFVAVPAMLVPLFWASQHLNTAVREVARTHEKMDLILGSRAAVRQSRELLHAYLASGNPEQAASYQRAAAAAWAEMWRFKELTLDNPLQVVNSRRFEQKLGESFKLGDELLAEKAKSAPRELTARVAAEEAINDGFRAAVGALVDEERAQLQAHEKALSFSVRTLQIISLLFAGVLLLFGYRSWRRVDTLLELTAPR
jgi:CHASE3 domain sensor protein